MPNRPHQPHSVQGRPDGNEMHDASRRPRGIMPLRAPQDFEGMLQRQLGPQLEQLKEFGSVMKDRLEQARRLFESRQMDQSMMVLRQLGLELRELRDLKARDPERFKLQLRIGEMDRRSAELGQKIRREADEAARKTSTDELKTLLGELFDLRQQEREKNVQQLDRELKDLLKQLETRKARRDEIIQHRFNQLTGKAELMEW